MEQLQNPGHPGTFALTIASGLHCIKPCKLVSPDAYIGMLNSFITSLGIDLSQVDHFSVATFVQRDTL